jgi:hypothetical protein
MAGSHLWSNSKNYVTFSNFFLAFNKYNSFIMQQRNLVDVHGRLRTVPGKPHFIGEKSQQIVCPAGCSLFWSSAAQGFYTADTVRNVRDQFGAQLIRAAMTAWSGWSDGYTTQPDKFEAHATIIADAAIALGMYVIIDWHCEGDNSGYVQQAKTFFGKMARKYAGVPNVIYEIWNEPKDQTWNASIRPYCVAVIEEIRRYDPLNLILCGTQTWSQKVEDAAKNPIPDVNVGYVLHFYSNLHGPWLYNNKHTLGVPVFVTEWGTPGEHPNTQGFVNWLRTNRIPHCSWAVNNKNEPLSYFVPSCRNTTGPWNLNTDLTPTGKIFQTMISQWAPAPAPATNPAPAPATNPAPAPATNPAPAPATNPAPAPATNPAPAPGQTVVRVEAHTFKSKCNAVHTVANRVLRFPQKRAWATYDLRIPRAGSYLMELRVKSTPSGGTFRIDYDAGKTVVGTVALPSSAEWTTVRQTVPLPAGNIRLGLFTLTDSEWSLEHFVLMRG